MSGISITNSLHQVAGQAWHSIEKNALHHPEKVKPLAIAAFAGTWFKHITLPVAEMLDRIHLYEKAYLEFLFDKESSQTKHYREACTQLNKIFFCFLKIVISPFKATYYAVITCVRMLQSPLKTTKIEAAEADLHAFLDIVHTERLAVEHAVARAAFERFESCVKQCATDTQAAELHFLDDDYVKEQILAKMQHRKEKYGEIVRSAIELPLHQKNQEKMLDNVFTIIHDLEKVESWKEGLQVTVKDGDTEISDKDEVEDLLFIPPPPLVNGP
jgi:hypothetical protein